MTSSEALKRSEKSQSLKVFHLENSTLYYVESSESKSRTRFIMKVKRNIIAAARILPEAIRTTTNSCVNICLLF